METIRCNSFRVPSIMVTAGVGSRVELDAGIRTIPYL